MDLITKYNNAEKELYEHVGFTPDWVMCPIADCTEMFWDVRGGEVHYADSKKELLEQDGKYYVDDIYTQRFYSKHVFEGEKLTMVMCDPHVDGVKWFRFFNNSKRQKYT